MLQPPSEPDDRMQVKRQKVWGKIQWREFGKGTSHLPGNTKETVISNSFPRRERKLLKVQGELTKKKTCPNPGASLTNPNNLEV